MPSSAWLVPVGAIAAVALVVALIDLPGTVRAFDNQAAHNASLSASDRELELVRTLGIDGDFVLAAERDLPARAAYSVETGQPRGASQLALQAVPAFLQNFLLPRLQVANAPWLLCYGCDLHGRHVRELWRKRDLVVAEVVH